MHPPPSPLPLPPKGARMDGLLVRCARTLRRQSYGFSRDAARGAVDTGGGGEHGPSRAVRLWRFTYLLVVAGGRCAEMKYWGASSRRMVHASVFLFSLPVKTHPRHRDVSQKQKQTTHRWHILERLLYVAMPVTYIWLLMFYLIFHVFLNLLAEVRACPQKSLRLSCVPLLTASCLALL